MYLNDANRNRVNCKSIQGTIEIWKDNSCECSVHLSRNPWSLYSNYEYAVIFKFMFL